MGQLMAEEQAVDAAKLISPRHLGRRKQPLLPPVGKRMAWRDMEAAPPGSTLPSFADARLRPLAKKADVNVDSDTMMATQSAPLSMSSTMSGFGRRALITDWREATNAWHANGRVPAEHCWAGLPPCGKEVAHQRFLDEPWNQPTSVS